ncbi:MAG: TerB family tellurite resistance protein [Alphaproteobacteria bacterium]|jgi:uncharacterized tellurite resistance protein B-like protein|nr:TerB family tellurite resistance protein [Alphaproteobacteria bacterium]MBT4016562.1 TerB family tellurite resistance protein [Alphaproteobacteria bacterium]MBT4967153.1 TerB family tellurite resistance protein [Alphaproteobacteria bacterium]MBT5158520.1 TerB family tellurite resistance protein [Alphaproteobacteria bacterium]MBT5920369.1 TerB family tellurite resistance protein [Alphaproteobacteria bacterium]
MLKRIKSILSGTTSQPEADKVEDERQIAAAALLVEAATLDDVFDDDERATIAAVLGQHFAIDAEACTALIEAAEEAQEESNHLLRFTRTIKDSYSPEDRIEIIEMLWEVAYADGVLHDYEANLLRRVGGLIYVSDQDRGEARKRVLTRMGLDD